MKKKPLYIGGLFLTIIILITIIDNSRIRKYCSQQGDF